MSSDENLGPAWQGFHHIALVTADFDATLRFYGDVLGMEVGRIMMGTDARGVRPDTASSEPVTQ